MTCDRSVFSTKQTAAQRLLYVRSDQITELKCGERHGISGGSCSSMEKRGALFRDAGITVDEQGGLKEGRSKTDKKWEKRVGKGSKKGKKRKKSKKGSTKGEKVKIEGEKGSKNGEMEGGNQQKETKNKRKYRKKGKELQSEQERAKLSRVRQIKEAE